MTNPLGKDMRSLDEMLSDVASSTRSNSLAVASTMPGGALRVVRPAGVGTSYARLYTQSGQFVDSVTWAAILTGKPVHSTSYFAQHPENRQAYQSQWLARFGYAVGVSVPLTAPVLPGYPGAIIALRGLGQPDYTPREIEQLADAAREFDTIHHDTMGSIRSSPTQRLFIATEGPRFLGRSPAAAGIDATLADQIERLAAERLALEVPSDNTGGDRVLLADSHGENHPFRVVTYASYPALSQGKVVLIARVPDWSEWLTLTADDFSADEEVARLLPAFKFMMEKYPEGITLRNIAKSVHLSPFHFHRRFTQQLGITPKHYLFDCQVAKAEELLLSGTHELEQIAKLCGFAHQSHFTSRFKQATGLTPTRWRRMKMNVMKPTGVRREV
ncbi:MAG: AraC family transcriptional regulator [Tepidisphaeraceae bacterium]